MLRSCSRSWPVPHIACQLVGCIRVGIESAHALDDHGVECTNLSWTDSMLKLEATSFNLDPRGTLCLTVNSNAFSLKADGILASIHHALTSINGGQWQITPVTAALVRGVPAEAAQSPSLTLLLHESSCALRLTRS